VPANDHCGKAKKTGGSSCKVRKPLYRTRKGTVKERQKLEWKRSKFSGSACRQLDPHLDMAKGGLPPLRHNEPEKALELASAPVVLSEQIVEQPPTEVLKPHERFSRLSPRHNLAVVPKRSPHVLQVSREGRL
jgi:hypothetical protein